MLIGEKIEQKTVFDHWALVDYEKQLQLEGLKGPELQEEANRRLMRDHGGTIQHLPKNIIWHKATIQESDTNNIYVMSEPSWDEICDNSTLVKVAQKVDIREEPNGGHCSKIRDLREYLLRGQSLEGSFIMITRDKTDPFTIIDGNHRLTAFHLVNRLVGLTGYVGFSPLVVNFCPWTRRTPFGYTIRLDKES